jgi:hypothetical protein
MSFLDWFTAGPKAAEQVLDAGIRGVDALVFTDEEKATARAKLMDGWIELQKTLGEETTVRGVTRRILAIMFSGVYILLSVGAVAVWKFDKEYADFMWDVANGTYGTISLTVVAFYFGPYFIEKLLGRKTQE